MDAGAVRHGHPARGGPADLVRQRRAGLNPAPETPLNVEIGPHRRYAVVRTDLRDFKTVKDAFGGTVNDVVLTVVSGALRSWLQSRGVRTEGVELRALVPGAQEIVGAYQGNYIFLLREGIFRGDSLKGARYPMLVRIGGGQLAQPGAVPQSMIQPQGQGGQGQ